MDFTPGGTDESMVPISRKLNAEVDLGERVQLLMNTVTSTLYNYISQVTRVGVEVIIVLARIRDFQSNIACPIIDF